MSIMGQESEFTGIKHWKFKASDEQLPPPGPLAEMLPPQLTVNALRHYLTFRNPEGQFASGWMHIEFAMNHSLALDSDMRQKYIGDAAFLFATAADNPRSHMETRLGAMVATNYLPVFSKRANNQPVTQDDCADIYRGLAATITYLTPPGSTVLESWRLTELIPLAMSARTGQPELLLYPASPREESSRYAQSNHDAYFVADKQKIALQQKLIASEEPYDYPFQVITLLPIVQNALKRTGYTDFESPTDAFEFVVHAMIAEAQDLDVQPYERDLLNLLSRSIAARRRYCDEAAA